jgi:hypothetical protein
LKARTFDRLKPFAWMWVKKLPSVVWAMCTTPSHAMGTHHFLWFMGLRQCYLRRWSTNLSTCSISMKNDQMTPLSMTEPSWRNYAKRQSSSRLSTNKPWDDTMHGTYVHAAFRWEISYYRRSKWLKTAISFHWLGRVPMKWSKWPDLVRIVCSERMAPKFQILGMMIS